MPVVNEKHDEDGLVNYPMNRIWPINLHFRSATACSSTGRSESFKVLPRHSLDRDFHLVRDLLLHQSLKLST
jgi:hypothetical protein